MDRVIDGDTVLLSVDLGFDHLISSMDFDGRTRLACRVYGINAPELSTDAGKEALSYAMSLLPAGSRVTVLSHGWDKYGGRFDGDIWLPGNVSFAQQMIDTGHAVAYKA